jgi:hypothetical protein
VKKLALIGKSAVVMAALIAAGFGASTATAKPPSSDPGCFCPDVWMPVICSDGNVYSNYCYASCAGASGCVPFGDDI